MNIQLPDSHDLTKLVLFTFCEYMLPFKVMLSFIGLEIRIHLAHGDAVL